jgi:uncharacterized protein involved in exopolysaccharide biosynthesis
MAFWALDKLWLGRARLVGGALLGFLLGLLALLVITPRYTAVMVVGPVSVQGPAAMGTPAARLEALRRNDPALMTDNLSDYDRYLQLLTSPASAELLIQRVPGLLPMLFPGHWNARDKAWRMPLAEWPAELFNRARGGAAWSAPTPADVAARIQKLLRVHVVGSTQMRELQLQYPDRGFALTLLFALHQAADNVLREEAARRSTAIRDYVTRQMETVRLAEHRAALTELLAAQERIQMLVAVDLPYAADIVEPPSAPTQPDVPQPTPILIIFAMLGLGAAAASLFWPRHLKLLPR